MTLTTGILLGIAGYAAATAATAGLLRLDGMDWSAALKFASLWPIFAIGLALLWDADGWEPIGPGDAEEIEAAKQRSSEIDDWSELKS